MIAILNRKIKEEKAILNNLEKEFYSKQKDSEEYIDLLTEIEIVLIKYHSLLGQRNSLKEFEEIKLIYEENLEG